MGSWPYVAPTMRDPDPPVFQPRRVRWWTNDAAVALVLAGVLMVAAAISLYGTGGQPDDIVGCPSLAAVDRLPAGFGGGCSPWRDDRAHFVRHLGLAGLILALLALATATRRWWFLGADRQTSWRTVVWSLLTPALFLFFTGPTLPPGQANDGVNTALGQVLVAGALLVTWRCASLRRQPVLRAHLLLASALAVPLVCAGTAVYEAHRWPVDPSARFPYRGGFTPLLLCCVVTAVLFALAVLLAKTSRRAPNVWIGGTLFAVAVAATLPVFVPDLVPAWKNVDAYGFDYPGRDVWLPILLAPVGLSVVVWATCALRPVRRPAEMEPVPR